MNRISITTCALCMSLAASAQVNYTIKGSATGMDGQTVYLNDAESGEAAAMDSVIISNNAFTFKGTQPKACFATVSAGRARTTLILEDGTINVSLDKSSGKATGTPSNDILEACNEKINAFNNEYKALRKQASELKEEDKDKMLELEKSWEDVSNRQTAVVKECINQNLNNIVGAQLLRRFESSLSSEEVTKILAAASPVMKENGYTQAVIKHQTAMKRAEVGQKYTDVKLKDVNGKEVALSDYIGTGKYVLIDFWASWCGPCRGEMPHVKAAYEKFASKGFEVVGISLDSKKEAWLKGIKDLGITWPQMSDLKGWKCEGTAVYGIRAIPATLLVDPNGMIIGKSLRGEEIEKKLNEVLK